MACNKDVATKKKKKTQRNTDVNQQPPLNAELFAWSESHKLMLQFGSDSWPHFAFFLTCLNICCRMTINKYWKRSCFKISNIKWIVEASFPHHLKLRLKWCCQIFLIFLEISYSVYLSSLIRFFMQLIIVGLFFSSFCFVAPLSLFSVSLHMEVTDVSAVVRETDSCSHIYKHPLTQQPNYTHITHPNTQRKHILST